MNRLAKVRIDRGMTRTELAAAVGVSERYIFFIEKGERNPSIKKAQAIAMALKSSTDEIFLIQKSTNSTLSHLR